MVQLGNGTIRYEFYKSGKKHVPSIFSFKTEGYKYTSQNKTYDYRTAREIVFKIFSPAKQSTFKNPVDISSNFWTDMKVSDEKGLVNLSAEELRFVKDKNDQD
jgi:spore germination cell wall hydrolase CwlJ-like protein